MKTSQPSVHLVKFVGSDLDVVNAARVSFAKESTELTDKDIKLINYLAKHGHWTPMAHNSLTFHIKAPIFVARQLVKHQVGGVWNEVSRRYVDDEPEFYFPEIWRGKPVNAKQGSSGIIENEQPFFHIDLYLRGVIKDTLTAYQEMIDVGMAPEQARMILPQNTMTEWWWTGSLMFFARVCNQRLDEHAQLETREIAQLINDAIPKEFYHSWQALRST